MIISCKRRIGDIDKGFAQAVDYLKCSDGAYVAFTSYTFIKYLDKIAKKLDTYKIIGLIIADRRRARVIVEVEESSNIEDELYDEVLVYMANK